MDTLLQDVRYAVRSLRRSPGFALVSILTLALGIGANVAIFSVVNGVLLRPLPYARTEELVRLHHVHPEQAPDGSVFSQPDLDDVRGGTRAFGALASYWWAPGNGGMDLTGRGEPQRVSTAFVSPEFFSVLGVGASHGRVLLPEEHTPGRNRSVVLSDAAWRARFGADPRIVGRTVTLNGSPFTVVGVMPPRFALPARETESWVPLSLIGEDGIPRVRENRFLQVVGRLREGVTPEAAAVQVDAVLRRLAREHPQTNAGWTAARTESLRDALVGQVRPALLVLLGAVALVLLVACANLANLLLARASGRTREVAVRTALGAGRRRLLRQMLTESLVLAVIGGAVGLLLAAWGVAGLLGLSAGAIPRPDEVGVDARVALFAVALTVVTAFLFGLVPALRTARGDTSASLREGGRGGTERHGARTRAALVLGQTAAAMVLLVGSALLLNSFWKLVTVDPGFRPDGVLVATFDIPDDPFDTDEKKNAFRSEVVRRVAEIPGVTAVGASKTQPLRGGGEPMRFEIPGRTGDAAELSPSSGALIVSSGYFRALGIPLVRGRVFTADEDGGSQDAVLVVNQAAARRYWPGRDPVGNTVQIQGIALTVVGVVGDVRNEGVARGAEPAVYLPYSLAPRSSTHLLVRTAGDPALLTEAVRGALRAANPLQPAAEIRPMRSAMSEAVAQPRFLTVLVGLFGGVAMVLAALGLYGVVSYAVARRTPEIGVRMALGAHPRDVVVMVVGHAATPALLGMGVGLGGAWLLSRLLSGLLFEVRPADPAAYAAAAATLAAVALLASWLPARRAARISPTAALRAD